MGGQQDTTFAVADPEEEPVDQLSGGLAVCLVSGGMDSCVTASIAARENEELAFLHVSYGQRT